MRAPFLLVAACLLGERVALRSFSDPQATPNEEKPVAQARTVKMKVRRSTHLRNSKNLADEDAMLLYDGDVVIGTFEDNRTWFKTGDKYVPSNEGGEAVILPPESKPQLPVHEYHPANEEALYTGKTVKMKVQRRIRLRNSKSFGDLDGTMVHIGEEVVGHFEGKTWFKTDAGKYLPNSIKGLKILAPLHQIADASKTIKLALQVPQGFDGLRLRNSMNMTDNDSATVRHGVVVEGRVQPGGEWFKTSEGKYLPMMFQGAPSLIPLPVRLKMKVRRSTHLRNSKNFSDEDTALVQVDDLLVGHFEDNGAWFKTENGKYLPNFVVGKLVPKAVKMKVRRSTHLRNSKSLTDEDTASVEIGDMVVGYFVDNHTWFKTKDGKYLPTSEGQDAIITPLEARAALNDTAKTVTLEVRVPRHWAGLKYRMSMDINDNDTETASWGTRVTGRVQPGGKWFKVPDGRYLPMEFQGRPALVPLELKRARTALKANPVRPVHEFHPLKEEKPVHEFKPKRMAKPVIESKSVHAAKPADGAKSGSEATLKQVTPFHTTKMTVRTRTHLRNTKNVTDEHAMLVYENDVVIGHFEDNRTWFKTGDKYLPSNVVIATKAPVETKSP